MDLPKHLYDHYWERGWVVVEGVIPPDKAKWVAERALELGRAKVGPDSSNYAADRSPDGSVIEPRKLDNPVAQDPAMGRALLESDLPDVIRQLIGVRPVFESDQIFFKPPRHGSVKHYHQDNAYFLMEPADHVITGWIALDDVDEANGCLRYISGSHRGPILPAKPVPGHEHDLMPDASLIDLSREELAPVKRGGVVFHHSQVLHGSGANTSDRWRRGFATHWIAADVRSGVPGLMDHGYPNRPELFSGWGEALIAM
jgi:phytanoyl-CoA hydroxylase